MKFIRKREMGELNDDAFIVYQTVPWFRVFINFFGRQIRYNGKNDELKYLKAVQRMIENDSCRVIVKYPAGENIRANRLVHINEIDNRVYEMPKNNLPKKGERMTLKPYTYIVSKETYDRYKK